MEGSVGIVPLSELLFTTNVLRGNRQRSATVTPCTEQQQQQQQQPCNQDSTHCSDIKFSRDCGMVPVSWFPLRITPLPHEMHTEWDRQTCKSDGRQHALQ